MTGELGVRIVTEVAAREGVDPTALTPPLHDVIDPDALDALFTSTPTQDRDGEASVSFTYNGYDITVTSDGDLTIREGPDVTADADATHETAMK